MEHAVDHQALVVQAERVQFVRGARRLGHRAGVRPGHQDDGGQCRIAQGVERGLEARLLHLQPRMRAEARRAPIVAGQEAAPRLGQAQQAQGVAGRRGVEDDVVVAFSVAGQQRRELVERGDLGGAGARQLLAHGRPVGVAGAGAHLRDDPLPIRLGSRVRIDVQHRQAGRARYRCGCVAQLDPQHLVQVRCGIGADQQHLLAGIRQRQRGGRRQRGLADTALAGEEQMPRRSMQEARHFGAQPAQHLRMRRQSAAVHDLPTDRDRRCRLDAELPDVLRVLDLHDVDLDPRRERDPLDHRDGAAALAASRSQNLDFHADPS